MRTDALIYADENLLDAILGDLSIEQAMNVACLPGIVGRSLAMPDIHQGYGFPIGGVAATRIARRRRFRRAAWALISIAASVCSRRICIATRPAKNMRELVNQLFRDVPNRSWFAGADSVQLSGFGSRFGSWFGMDG